jgi:adenine-specific DNA-methyltransferase
MSDKYKDFTKEQLIEEINQLKRQKRFGLVWESQPEEVVKECEQKLPVLDELSDRAINKAASTDPTHLVIEGDNYHSLSVLNYTHAGKVDLVYIDPPYNTGNKDFIYNDRFVERENTYRHSKWLSFMAKRLELVKSLLKDTGAVFISIDDNEQAHLKLLCDQIFGAENFINQFIWINNLKGRQIQGVGAAGTREYVLCYGKNWQNISQFQYSASFLKQIMPSTYKGFNNDVKEDNKGKYITSNELYNTNSAFNEETRPNLVFDIYYRKKDGDIVFDDPHDKSYTRIEPHANADGTHKYHAYRWSKKKILAEIYDLEFIKSGNTYKIYTKRRDFDATVVKDLITDIATNQGGTELKTMGVKGFDYPKPTNLIEFLIAISTNNNATILDFFAGSGTTGHAVLKLNERDGGNRQFILCSTNDEKEPIVDNVLYPRIQKVIDGYGSTAGIPANVRYFKTNFVEKEKSTDATRAKLVERCSDMIRIRENTFTSVTDTPEYKFYASAETFTAIIFDPFKMAEIWGEIETKNTKKLPVKLYVFAYSRDTSAFTDEIPDTNLVYESVSIPESILQVYKRLFENKGGRK